MKAVANAMQALKHPLQHLLPAILIAAAFSWFFHERVAVWSVVVGFYCIDFLDHPIRLLVGRDRFLRRIRRMVVRRPVLAARLYGREHKRVRGLLLHSFPGLGLTVAAAGALVLWTDSSAWQMLLFQVIGHQLFDIADDLKQLGHINNWKLWRHWSNICCRGARS